MGRCGPSIFGLVAALVAVVITGWIERLIVMVAGFPIMKGSPACFLRSESGVMVTLACGRARYHRRELRRPSTMLTQLRRRPGRSTLSPLSQRHLTRLAACKSGQSDDPAVTRCYPVGTLGCQFNSARTAYREPSGPVTSTAYPDCYKIEQNRELSRVLNRRRMRGRGGVHVVSEPAPLGGSAAG